tara:strand:- start:63 stop:260 length:198 start_codon:yes stop_codon:yes gene_type:complete
MSKKKYYSLNQVPIGTEMIVKSSGEKGVLLEIQNFPTTFKIEDSQGVVKNYYTYEVEILNWPPKE